MAVALIATRPHGGGEVCCLTTVERLCRRTETKKRYDPHDLFSVHTGESLAGIQELENFILLTR